MLTLEPDEFLQLMEDKGYSVFDSTERPLDLNIVGIRNKFGAANRFNDTIAVYYIEKSKWVVKSYPATTLPGIEYLTRPVSSRGTAILAEGQYKGSYAIGLHKSQYEALVQVKPVTVYRDKNQDKVYNKDPKSIEHGLFGINIHRASLHTFVVGVNSAGCQVFQKAKDFNEFMTLCRESAQYWGNQFTYTLVEI